MISRLLIIAVFISFASIGHAQMKKVTIEYPCTQSIIHDTTMSRVDSFYTARDECKYLLFGLIKRCKTVYDLHTKEVSFPESVVHDTTVTCYKDTVICDGSAEFLTTFGIKLQVDGVDAQVDLLKQLGLNMIRPSSITIKDYQTKKNTQLQQFAEKGVFTIVNLVWITPVGGQTRPFCTDTAAYRNSIRQVFKDLGQYIGIAVIENEPVNEGYYTGRIEDYIAILKIATEEAHRAGVKITDGCNFVEYLVPIIDGVTKYPKNRESNFSNTKKILEALKTIPLDFVNIHFSAKGNDYPDGQLKKVANYLRTLTGKDVICNEWHFEGATPNLVKEVTSQFREAAIPYAQLWGGGRNSPADAINEGTILTPLGEVYRDAVK